jgi:hypothetical protein
LGWHQVLHLSAVGPAAQYQGITTLYLSDICSSYMP